MYSVAVLPPQNNPKSPSMCHGTFSLWKITSNSPVVDILLLVCLVQHKTITKDSVAFPTAVVAIIAAVAEWIDFDPEG